MKALVGIVLALFSMVVCSAQESYPMLKIGDETYKNVRVVKATPLELTLLYDGGGHTIKPETPFSGIPCMGRVYPPASLRTRNRTRGSQTPPC